MTTTAKKQAPELESVEKNSLYTEQDYQDLNLIKQWLEDHSVATEDQPKVSQAHLGRISRVAPSTLNHIITGIYQSSPSKQIAQVLSAIKHFEEDKNTNHQFVETSISKIVHTACVLARRHKNFSLISSNVGTGKTHSLKYYQKTHTNVFMIEADKMMTPQILVKELAKQVLGSVGNKSNAELYAAIINQLTDTDSLIIFDEADTVTAKQLELLRRIRDKANVGVVIAGTDALHYKINPEDGEFDQIRSRTGFWPPVIRSISRQDVEALAQVGFGEEELRLDVMDRLWKLSKGSARMLCENLIPAIQQYRKDKPLTVELIDAIAESALGLKKGS